MAKRKKKINYQSIFILIILILAIVFMFFFLKEVLSDKNENKNEENEAPVVEPPKEKTEEEKKLDKLNNINEKIDFFKMENLDRYLDYKEKNPDLDDETIVVYVNIGLDKPFYTDVKDSTYKHDTKVIANKVYFLGKDYEPKNLVTINNNYSSGGKQMVKEAAEAFEKMAKDAKSAGYTVRAVSTYRSYSYQEGLYNRYAASDGKEKADTYSARPGYSEHQTGLAVDVDNARVSYTSFGDTKEFTWMKENSYKYGYILRYTKANEFITGYKDEPWHYRYVGVEIATYIHEHPMTYEEYYVRFLDK